MLMMGLLRELMEHVGDSKIIVYVSLAAILITVIIHFIFRKYSKYIKYLPGLIMIVTGIIRLFTTFDVILEPEGLENLMFFITFVVSGFVGIFAALILGVYEKPIKKRRKKDKKVVEAEEKA